MIPEDQKNITAQRCSMGETFYSQTWLLSENKAGLA